MSLWCIVHMHWLSKTYICINLYVLEIIFFIMIPKKYWLTIVMACAPSREPELRIDECQLDVKIGRKPAPEVEAVSTRSQSHNLTVVCPDVPCALCSGTVVCPPRPRRRHCGSGARWSLTAVVPVPDGGDRSAVNMESCPRAEKLGCRWLCWFSPSSSLHRGRKVKQM